MCEILTMVSACSSTKEHKMRHLGDLTCDSRRKTTQQQLIMMMTIFCRLLRGVGNDLSALVRANDDNSALLKTHKYIHREAGKSLKMEIKKEKKIMWPKIQSDTFSLAKQNDGVCAALFFAVAAPDDSRSCDREMCVDISRTRLTSSPPRSSATKRAAKWNTH